MKSQNAWAQHLVDSADDKLHHRPLSQSVMLLQSMRSNCDEVILIAVMGLVLESLFQKGPPSSVPFSGW